MKLALNVRPDTQAMGASRKADLNGVMLLGPGDDVRDPVEIVEAFRIAMRDAELSAPDIIADGKLHRFRVDGDRRSDTNGWYVLHLDSLPAGAFGCWKRGINMKWRLKDETVLTERERESLGRKMEAIKRQREAEERAQRERTVDRGRKLLRKAREADPRHPYLVAKSVRPFGIRQLGDTLLVPVAGEDNVAGLQFILPTGEKRFLTGTAKRGRYYLIGDPDGRVIIAEGYATAASLYEATGIAAVVAFDADNLLPVATAIRERFPRAEIVIAGDNDRHTEGNPGKQKAIAAAGAIGGSSAIPDFDRGDPGTDWNDVAVSHGIGAVAAAVASHFRPRAVAVGDVKPEAVSFAIEGLATAREPVLIVSEDGAGKTTLLLAILCAMAAEELLFDRFSVTGGPVLFISEEDSETVLANHATAIARGHGWDEGRIRDRLHILALAGVHLEDEHWRQIILDEVRRTGAVAVGLDPYADLTNAKENSNDETRPIKAFLREICRYATPFVCHHAGKPAEGKRKRDRIRGASALAAAARSTLFIEETRDGIAVEPLKLSRSVRHPRFVLSREIESEAENPAQWRRARLSYVSGQQAQESVAREFVVASLEQNGSLTSTAIRRLAKGSGPSAADVAKAVKELHESGRILFDPGPRNARNWRLSLPTEAGQDGQLTLPNLPHAAGQGA